MNGALSGPAAAVVLQAALDLFTYKQVVVNEYANGSVRACAAIPNVIFA